MQGFRHQARLCLPYNTLQAQVSAYLPSLKHTPFRLTVTSLGLEAQDIGDTGYQDGDIKFERLYEFLADNPGPTLVYVTRQEQADDHASRICLQPEGFKARSFHAGLDKDVKREVQDAFMSGEVDIVVATIAFGMGIDKPGEQHRLTTFSKTHRADQKPDIPNVVHWDCSATIEEYSQQTGRAGRDGLRSKCMSFISPGFAYTRETFARGDIPSRHLLRGLLDEIFRAVPVANVLKFSHSEQGSMYDIRASPLKVIYALLELHYDFIRAITPEYSGVQV